MTRHLLASIFTFCCVLSLGTMVNAQPPGSKPVPQVKKRQTAAKPPARADNQADEAQRVFAIQTISALADEARGYKDESLRASVQARAADALWDIDPERARTLFDRAWEAATAVDQAGRRRNEEARRRFLSGQGGIGFIPPPPNLRAEVLRLASKRDRVLAESFLAQMEKEDKRAEEENNTASFWDPTEPPAATARRLELARQLLEGGDTERALLVAKPGLNRVTSQGIVFLVLLRQKNADLADQGFAALLEKAAVDPTADATSISLLSSYVFTPSVLVTVTRNGLLMNPWLEETLPPPKLSPALRTAFCHVAIQILTRPIPPVELERTSAGRAGTYFTMMRLLPLFKQSDPEAATALQGRLNVLAQEAEGLLPEQQRAFINAGLNPKASKEEGLNDALARVERAASTDERNYLLAIAAHAAVMQNDPGAQALADKIEDPELKRRVRNFVDFTLVSKALEKKDAEQALRLARPGELSPFQRVWAYTESARLLKSPAPQRARELLAEAMTEARRIAATGPENAQAWVAIANSALVIDPDILAETISEAVKAINKAPDYTGEEDKVSARFQSRSAVAAMDIAAPLASLANLYGKLGREDIYFAADTARSITNESPRAVALLAAAQSVLEQKPVGSRR